jgi:hypothetical protein
MPDTSPRLELPYIQPSQAQKHVTHNEALRLLDTLVQMVVRRLDATDPPGDAAPGDVYGLGDAPIGSWAGQAGKIAFREGGAWRFAAPQEGWRVWNVEAGHTHIYTSGLWKTEQPDLSDLDGVGIGTNADAVNRLAVAADATLLTHAGAGHQLKLNKARTSETASLLFQTGYDGRAEMGLAGDDTFSIKMRAPGSAWSEALRLDPEAQTVTLGNGGDTEMRLASAGLECRLDDAGTFGDWQQVYHQGNAVGTVQQSAGAVTGAIVERGTNANGEYVRFADGTQICWFTKGSDSQLTGSSGGLFWAQEICIFPAIFVDTPAVSPNALDVSSGLYWGTASGIPSATSFTFEAIGTSDGGSYRLSYLAIGHWY